MTRHFLAGTIGLLLVACAPTVPVLVITPEPAEAPAVRSASEVMNERAVTPREGTGVIVVKRAGPPWSVEGCTVDVALDDEPVARLRPGEQVVLFADPGQRVVSLNVRDEASCRPAGTHIALDVVERTTQRIDIDSDRRYDLTVEVDSWGRSLPR